MKFILSMIIAFLCVIMVCMTSDDMKSEQKEKRKNNDSNVI